MAKGKNVVDEKVAMAIAIDLTSKVIYLDEMFYKQYNPYSFSTKFAMETVMGFIVDLSFEGVKDALAKAINKIPDKPEDALKYFCGICWNKIKCPNSLVITKNI